MKVEEPEEGKTIYYFSRFDLFSQQDRLLLTHYKVFVESALLQLGEDWKI